MSLKRVLAAGAVSTALAVSGLTLTTGPATAGTAVAARSGVAATTYSCSFGLLGTFDVPATFSLPSLPAQLPAGVPIPELPLVGQLQLPAGLPALLLGLGTTLKATVDQLLVSVGAAQVAVALNGPTATLASILDGLTLQLSGVVPGFTPGSAGPLPFTLPTGFDLGLLTGLGSALGVFHCTLKGGAPSSLATATVVKQSSSVKGKVVGRTVKKGSRGTLSVKVRRQAGKAVGKVVATLQGKVVGSAALKGGKASLRLKKLAVGTWKVTVQYLGDDVTGASRGTVRVRVVG